MDGSGAVCLLALNPPYKKRMKKGSGKDLKNHMGFGILQNSQHPCAAVLKKRKPGAGKAAEMLCDSPFTLGLRT